jgi:Uma2 family endonuclease
MSTALTVPCRATPTDLAHAEGKGELVGGKLVLIMPTGHRPGLVALRIVRRLVDHADAAGGFAYGSFAVPELSSGRESFSPEAAYYTGPPPADAMRFVPGPPDFAAEVRSEGDYGPTAEAALAAKRAKYFEAGTRVVGTSIRLPAWSGAIGLESLPRRCSRPGNRRTPSRPCRAGS